MREKGGQANRHGHAPFDRRRRASAKLGVGPEAYHIVAPAAPRAKKARSLDSGVNDQLFTGRVRACVSSRPPRPASRVRSCVNGDATFHGIMGREVAKAEVLAHFRGRRFISNIARMHAITALEKAGSLRVLHQIADRSLVVACRSRCEPCEPIMRSSSRTPRWRHRSCRRARRPSGCTSTATLRLLMAVAHSSHLHRLQRCFDSWSFVVAAPTVTGHGRPASRRHTQARAATGTIVWLASP